MRQKMDVEASMSCVCFSETPQHTQLKSELSDR